MPLGPSGAGRLPAINREHKSRKGALWSSCCALRHYRRRRYTGKDAGSNHPTGMALQLLLSILLKKRACPVCKYPRWLPASQSITPTPNHPRWNTSPQIPLRGSSLLFVTAKSRQKPCDTLTLAKSLLIARFFRRPGTHSLEIRRFLAVLRFLGCSRCAL